MCLLSGALFEKVPCARVSARSARALTRAFSWQMPRARVARALANAQPRSARAVTALAGPSISCVKGFWGGHMWKYWLTKFQIFIFEIYEIAKFCFRNFEKCDFEFFKNSISKFFKLWFGICHLGTFGVGGPDGEPQKSKKAIFSKWVHFLPQQWKIKDATL